MKPFYEIGRYECEITSQGFRETKTGNTQFVLRFQVKGRIDPANPDNMFDVTSYERSYYRVLTDNTIEYFENDMEALGVEFASFTELDPLNPNHTNLTGRSVDMFCSHEAGQNGDLREKWGIARVAKPVESIESNHVKALDRLFGKHLKHKPKTAVAARASQPSSSNDLEVTEKDIIDDSDIPF